jgi:hypothetical protein
MSRPIAFAVLRLTTSSYFVGACTGRSAGFSPLRILNGKVDNLDSERSRGCLRDAPVVDRDQQTAGPDQGNELTPFKVEHGDFLPDALSESPTGPCSVFRSFSLP